MTVASTETRSGSRPPDGATVMAQIGRENFPVASRLLGQRARQQLIALYGYARLVDDIGDEAEGDRGALLDWLEGELELAFAGAGRTATAGPQHPVMRSLAQALALQPLPRDPFRRLIEANRRDQVVTRYRTFEDLLDYCRLSAAPVGELVLHVFGAATPERVKLSDHICAGLQVLEHIQDIHEDQAQGRIYMPVEDMARFGCREAELAATEASGPVRALVAFEVARAHSLLSAGAPLVRTLALRPRLAVAGFLAGGRAALSAIEAAGCDTLGARPAPARTTFVREWAKGVRGR